MKWQPLRPVPDDEYNKFAEFMRQEQNRREQFFNIPAHVLQADTSYSNFHGQKKLEVCTGAVTATC